MTGAEIAAFAARLAQITNKGVRYAEAEPLAEKLIQHDRKLDDRNLCLECNHLSGSGPSSWRCGNWRRAGVAVRARDADLPRDLVQLLQRCSGFNAAQI
jgi:hypothetical protein